MALASSAQAALIAAAAPARPPAAARSSSSTQSLPSVFKVCLFRIHRVYIFSLLKGSIPVYVPGQGLEFIFVCCNNLVGTVES
jgi:hypothetical protein